MLQKHRTFHLQRERERERARERERERGGERERRRKDKLELLHKFYSLQYCFVSQARLATLVR